MAEVTVLTGGTQAQPPPIEDKKPVGRPRKDGQPAGTPPLAQSADPEDFFLMLPSITADEWQFRMLYLYRLYPITDRRGAGQPVYLNKFSEVVDRDRVMRDYGSGIYKLELLQTIPNERGKKIAVCMFQILNQDYPPKVPAGEWVNDPRNADWEWCRPKLGPGSLNAAGSASPDDIANAVYAKVHQNEQPKKDDTPAILAVLANVLDPKRQTDMIATFATLMKPKEDGMSAILLPLILKMLDKPAGPDPIVTMLMEDRRAMREEMNRLREQQTAPKDTLDSLLENKEKFEALRGLFGKGSGSAAPEGWAGIADKAIDKLAGPVGQIGLIAAQRYMMQQPAAPQQAALPRPAIQPTAVQVTPQPVGAQPEQPPAAPVVDQQSVLVAKYQGVIAQAFPFLLDHFKDRDGYEFRDWFISPMRFGNSTWFQMRQEIGVDGFVNFLATLPPEIQAQLSPPEKFKTFMTEFFSDDDPEEGEDEDEDEFSKPPAE